MLANCKVQKYLTGFALLVLIFGVTGIAAAPAAGDPEAGPAPSVAPSRPHVAAEPEPARGFIPPEFDLPEVEAPLPHPALPLSDRFDWREGGKVTSVKNQGACGSCYAFAVAGNVESRLLIDGEGTFDFSENNLKECDYPGSSCGGGNYWREANLLSTRGTVLETCDPYVPSNVACNTTCPNQVTLVDWLELSRETAPSVETIKTYIQTYGPVYSAINAGHGDAWAVEFDDYDGTYTLHTDAVGSSNHAILIVGWDDTLSHAGGQGAWIVKNSWGTSWGGTCGYGTEGGYFTLAYGSANAGSWTSFIADWQFHDSEDILYYYDEAGYTSSVGYGSVTAWGLCKYIPEEDVVLGRVEFWSADATTDVDVYIYDTFSGGTLSGLVASQLNSTFSLAGYHSIEIASSPEVTAGNDVYVVARITNASYTYPLIYDSSGPKSPGTSYISYNGTSWTEWAAGDLGLRLRAMADGSCGIVPEEPVLATISDVSGDDGGQVRLAWARSMYDAESATPQVKRYKVWRLRSPEPGDLLGGSGAYADYSPPATPKGPVLHGEAGSVWELVGVVGATGQCGYAFNAPTHCDSSGSDPCWTHFFVSAHTGTVGEHFDSPVDSGYSVNDLLAQGDRDETNDPIPYGPDQDAVVVTALATPEPNPAAGGFVIRYDLASADWHQVDVYDIAGRRVATLADGLADQGHYVARWDGRLPDGMPAAPGIYFVRLATASGCHTAKLVLVR